MPARTNRFQKLVLLVKEHFAGNAIVTESKMLVDRVAGKEREVDICIESQLAGHTVVMCIECTKRGRKPDVNWVENMKAKHERLPTHLLVLASFSGFSAEARRVARSYGIETIFFSPRDFLINHKLDGAKLDRFFGEVNELLLKLFDVHPARIRIWVGQTGDAPPETIRVSAAHDVFSADGDLIGNVGGYVGLCSSSSWFIKELGRAVAGWKPQDREGRPLYLRQEDPSVLRAIELIEVSGNCRFNVSRFPLKYGVLGGVKVAWSAKKVKNGETMLVASQDESGKKRVTITMPGLKLGPAKQI